MMLETWQPWGGFRETQGGLKTQCDSFASVSPVCFPKVLVPGPDSTASPCCVDTPAAWRYFSSSGEEVAHGSPNGATAPGTFTAALIYGGLAQLGERLAGSQKVRGSNPLSSTYLGSRDCRAAFGDRCRLLNTGGRRDSIEFADAEILTRHRRRGN